MEKVLEMKERVLKELNNLSNEESKQIMDNLKEIFKGGVTFKNAENVKENMTNYYKSFN